MKKRSIVRILAVLLLLSLAITASQSRTTNQPATGSQASPAPPPTPTTIYLAPHNITDLNDKPNSTITLAVNVTQAPQLNAFTVILDYNSTILQHCDTNGQHCPTVDDSNGVLEKAGTVTAINECIDAHKQAASETDCSVADHIGRITVSLGLKAAVTNNITVGTLFQVTFTVASYGLAQFHFFNATLVTATLAGAAPTQVQGLQTVDGFFTNLDCPLGSGIACRPPDVTISYSPSPAVKNTPITFNATVTEHNKGAAPLYYYWDFGDQSQLPVPASRLSPRSIVVQHTYRPPGILGQGGACVSNGVCILSLTVYDNESISWTVTSFVSILNIFTKVAVGTVSIDHQSNVIPGTIIHISADITNFSTIAENATMSIWLEHRKLVTTPFSLAAPGTVGQTATLNATWDTTGFSPRAYQIVMNVSKVVSTEKISGPNGPYYLTTQNDTSGNLAYYYVILVSPLITGLLSLSLIQTSGLAALILVAVALGVARFTRKPSYEKEPL